MEGEHVTADSLDRPHLDTWGDDPQAVMEAAHETRPLLQGLGEVQVGQLGMLIEHLAAGSALARVLLDATITTLEKARRAEAARADPASTWLH